MISYAICDPLILQKNQLIIILFLYEINLLFIILYSNGFSLTLLFATLVCFNMQYALFNGITDADFHIFSEVHKRILYLSKQKHQNRLPAHMSNNDIILL